MQLSIFRGLIWFLGFSQVISLWIGHEVGRVGGGIEKGVSSEIVEVYNSTESSKVIGRADNGANIPTPLLSLKPAWGNTWFGYVAEPANSGWTTATIVEMAAKAWHARTQHSQAVNKVLMIAALWVPREGVWLGSVVQGPGNAEFRRKAPILAPRLWKEVKDRKFTGSSLSSHPAMYHAEDAAMFWHESNASTGETFA